MNTSLRVADLAQELGANRHELVALINGLELGFSVDNPATKLTSLEVVLVKRAMGLDINPLDGVWRRVSSELRGREVRSSETHIVVHNGTWRSYSPGQVFFDDDPHPARPFELAWTEEFVSARISVDFGDPKKFRGLTRLRDEHLEIRWGSVLGQFPERMSDPAGVLTVYVRESAPEVCARVSDRPEVHHRPRLRHPKLGEFRFLANVNTWESETEFEGERVRIYVDGEVEMGGLRLEQCARRLKRLDVGAAKRHAASHLLQTHNRHWRERGTIDAVAFVAYLTISSISFAEDETMSLHFDDGNLFWGHDVYVVLDEHLIPTDARFQG